MEFGIFNVMQQRHREKSSVQVFSEAVDQTRLAEELGFDSVWFVEHHASNYSLCPSPLVMAAHCAGFTSRIRLGTAVIVAPLYHPTRLLAEIALVDTLSNGRLDLGIGTGYQAYEFEKFGVDLADKVAMTNELLDLLESGLQGDSIEYDGDHFPIDELAISVQPIQQPHPPIWMTSTDPEMQRRAARNGYSMFTSGHLGGTGYIERNRAAMAENFTAEGMELNERPLNLLRMAFVSNDPAEVEHYADCARYQQRLAAALKQRRERVSEDHMVEEQPFEGEPSFERLLERLPIGDVDTVIQRVVDELRRVRPSQMVMQVQIGDLPQKAVLRSMELFAKEVRPAVEHELRDLITVPASAAG